MMLTDSLDGENRLYGTVFLKKEANASKTVLSVLLVKLQLMNVTVNFAGRGLQIPVTSFFNFARVGSCRYKPYSQPCKGS